MGIIRCVFLRRRHKSKRFPISPPSPTETPIEELQRVFEKFDSNGDGKISSLELNAIFQSLGHPMTEDELHKMMSEADIDGDGFISLPEFVELNTHKVDPTTALEDLHHAFSMFDLDRNGSISPDELAKVLRSLGEGVSVAECKRMIHGVDQDGDGLISFEEFQVMMTGSPHAASPIGKIH